MHPEELIKHLVIFSKSDQDFNDAEFVFILNVAESLNVSQSRTEEIIREVNDEKIISPKSEHHRMQILYHLLFLMKIDKNINVAEREMIHHYGFKLGFSRSMVNDFIDLITEYKDGIIPTDGMIEIIKKYQN